MSAMQKAAKGALAALADMLWLESFLQFPEASVHYECGRYLLYCDAVPTPVSVTGRSLRTAISKMRRALA